MSELKAVIFDLDGVLTDTAGFHFKAWRQMALSIGIDIDEAFNETLKGIDRRGSLERILAKGGLSFSEEEKERLAAEKNAQYVSLIASMSQEDLLPGALARLKELKERGIKIGLASASRNAPSILEFLGILGYFDTIADPAQVKAGKPEPDLFLLALAQLEVKAEEAWGVEDAVSGIESIHRAGMKAIGIGSPALLSAADLVFPGLDCFSFIGPNMDLRTVRKL